MLYLRTGILSLMLAGVVHGATPSTCGLGDEYARGLCAYQRRQFDEAEGVFRAIVERDAKEPQTMKAMYFLARTLMKRGRFDDASALLIRIYVLDKPFYDGWGCDFLLGECRRALGKDEG
jgi:TolA-binding protein